MSSKKRKVCAFLSTLITCIPYTSSAMENKKFLNKKTKQPSSLSKIMQSLCIETTCNSKPKIPQNINERFAYDKISNHLYFIDPMEILRIIGVRSRSRNDQHKIYGRPLQNALRCENNLPLAQLRATLFTDLAISFEFEHSLACYALGRIIVANSPENLKARFWNHLEDLYINKNLTTKNTDPRVSLCIEQIMTIQGLENFQDAQQFLKDLIISRKKVAGKHGKGNSNKKDETFQPIIDKLREVTECSKDV